jgi:inner membrane protein involved in colicin E2 resistance
LVLSEEYALLLCALAVFALRAGTLIGTRRLDGYRLADARREVS